MEDVTQILMNTESKHAMWPIQPKIPATAVQSKSGAYASLHLHGERGCFSVKPFEAWSMDSNKKRVYLKENLHGFSRKGGIFTIFSP